jgi:protein SCO1/2
MKALGILLTTVALVVSACGADEEVGLAGQIRTPAPNVGDVSLPEVTGGDVRDFAFTAREDSLLLLYFGYTGCPDICPTTLADLRSAIRTLDDEQAGRVDVAFATIDPNRDTNDVMTAYIRAFFPEKGIAIRTDDPEELENAADSLGVIYSVEEDDDGTIFVEHSAWVYVIDDTGTLLVSWPFGIEPEAIASDIRLLLKETTA